MQTLTLVLETKIVRYVCTWISYAPLKQEDTFISAYRNNAAVRQLLLGVHGLWESPVFWLWESVCLSAHVIEEGGLDVWQTAGTTSYVSPGEELWGALVNTACVCRHNGKVSSTSKFSSSELDQLVSGLVACVCTAGGIQKTVRPTAWARGSLKRQDEPGVGVYVCRSKFSLLILTSILLSLIT